MTTFSGRSSGELLTMTFVVEADEAKAVVIQDEAPPVPMLRHVAW